MKLTPVFVFKYISKNRIYTLPLYFLIVILASGLVGYFYGGYSQKEKYTNFLKSFKNIRENTDKYSYINPLIGGVSAPATDVGIYSDIKGDITKYFKTQEIKGNLFSYSFYFRDMGTGLWFGNNEADTFFPASLFKLPIAIAAYKEGEDDPTFLQKTVVYTQEISNMNSAMQLNSQSVLLIGKAYSVKELVEIMLKQSDNGAKDLILSVLDFKYLNQLFSLVALVDPRTTQTYVISSRKYALFFRVLYGSSYLNEEHSELIMGMLTNSTFKDGLVAGLPKNIATAHKYGVYQFEELINGKKVLTQQLHDCGIIYHAEKPYIFCLMTKGKDEETLQGIIAHVSKMVYDYQENAE